MSDFDTDTSRDELLEYLDRSRPRQILEPDQFHDLTLTTLARLQIGQESLVEQVKKQNGSVASLTQRMSLVESAIENHPLKCPIAKDVMDLSHKVEKAEAVKVATDKTNDSWWTKLKPLFWVIGGGILVLLLLHADTLLNKL